MTNCHDDIVAFHDQEVTLSESERAEMRKRRDTNRERLKRGLERAAKPSPIQFRSQGSYAMRTMIQQPERDYDIDDGVIFPIERLAGPRGGHMTPGAAKEMVCAALDDSRFAKAPEVKTNCVRIYYDRGYHVDVPVYRRVERVGPLGQLETYHELASTDWMRSEPFEATEWFLQWNKRQSPDLRNGGQMRRIVRLLKAFARSRRSWRGRIASGFMISALVVECYRPCHGRDDRALYDTIRAICDRLRWDLEVQHPVVAGATITKGQSDARTQFLRARLAWALKRFKELSRHCCTRERTLRVWDRVFAVSFFSGRLEERHPSGNEGFRIGIGATHVLRRPSAERRNEPVDNRGGRRYA